MGLYVLLKWLGSTVRAFLLLVMASILVATAAFGTLLIVAAIDAFISSLRDPVPWWDVWPIIVICMVLGSILLKLVFDALKQTYEELPWDKVKVIVLGDEGDD